MKQHCYSRLITTVITLLVLFTFSPAASSQTIFQDNFSSVDTSGGPVTLNGVAIPGTSPNLQWSADSRFEVVEFGTSLTRAVLNPVATEGNGSGPITVVQTSDPTQGIDISEFELSFDAYYFSTTSGGGNNWAGVNYFVDSVVFNRNVSTGGDVGFKMEYRMRNSGNSFDYRLLMNDGSGLETVVGSEGTLTIPDLLDNSSSTVPGDPVNLSISVLSGVHSLSINGSEVYSISISDGPENGFFNFVPTNNRDNGFSNVSLTQIPEPGLVGLLIGVTAFALVFYRRKKN